MSEFLTFTWGRSSPLPVFSGEGGQSRKSNAVLWIICGRTGAALLTDCTFPLSSPTERFLMNRVLTGLSASRGQVRWAGCSGIPVAMSPRMSLL